MNALTTELHLAPHSPGGTSVVARWYANTKSQNNICREGHIKNDNYPHMPLKKGPKPFGCQTNGIYIKKLKSSMYYILKIHKVINTV